MIANPAQSRGKVSLLDHIKATAVPGHLTGNRSICIVDQNADAVDALTAMLKDLGAEIHVYDSAESFLDALEDGAAMPACLIAEIELPGMTGLELLEVLRERGNEPPTVMVASDARVSLAVRAMRAGVIDYFEKPFIEPRLRGLVRSLVEGPRDFSGL